MRPGWWIEQREKSSLNLDDYRFLIVVSFFPTVSVCRKTRLTPNDEIDARYRVFLPWDGERTTTLICRPMPCPKPSTVTSFPFIFENRIRYIQDIHRRRRALLCRFPCRKDSCRPLPRLRSLGIQRFACLGSRLYPCTVCSCRFDRGPDIADKQAWFRTSRRQRVCLSLPGRHTRGRSGKTFQVLRIAFRSFTLFKFSAHRRSVAAFRLLPIFLNTATFGYAGYAARHLNFSKRTRMINVMHAPVETACSTTFGGTTKM